MRSRVLVLVLSLVMAILPSWAGACAMSASLTPCQHDMSGTGQGSQDGMTSGHDRRQGVASLSPGDVALNGIRNTVGIFVVDYLFSVSPEGSA